MIERKDRGPPRSLRKTAADRSQQPGMIARDLAVSAVFAVMVENRAFDDAFQRAAETRPLEPRDRAFARALATTVLRRHGELKFVIGRFLQKPLPEGQGRLEAILLAAAAQLLFLETPPHAAISLAVDQCHSDKAAQRFANLVNAVLRRVSEQGRTILQQQNAPELDVPEWLLSRWRKTYGDAVALEIARASLAEPPLDLTVKSGAEDWAGKLEATVLPTNSLRLSGAGRIEELPGFEDGAWWVQDAAAALPAKLFRDITGREVLDLCAAPGGKTAQLAAAGALVTALDKSPGRLKRLSANLKRLGLEAETVVADAAMFNTVKRFDAVLVDAPCTSTGTIRRHPDVLHLKRPEDVAVLAALQARILDGAASLVKPGGQMVYCTCSLEAEEGPEQIAGFLQSHPQFARLPVEPGEGGIEAEWVTAEGDVRTLPCHLGALPRGLRGLDGFYVARLHRMSA